MRHGRKSRHQRFDGYKRHVLKDLDLGVVRAVGLTLLISQKRQSLQNLKRIYMLNKSPARELHIDRAYLTSH